jgi:hypothetical protein
MLCMLIAAARRRPSITILVDMTVDRDCTLSGNLSILYGLLKWCAGWVIMHSAKKARWRSHQPIAPPQGRSPKELSTTRSHRERHWLGSSWRVRWGWPPVSPQGRL